MNAALIGLGMVAGTHVAALKDAEGVALRGVLGRSEEKTKAFAKEAALKTGVPVAAFASVEEIARDPAVDFVIVATPPDARAEIVAPLVAAKKPILIEKPIERTFDAAQGIVSLCATQAVPLGIVFQHRARAASRALKEAVTSGSLGDILSAELRVPWWRDQSYYEAPGRGTYARDGGGVMINQAIHTLDLALWILGPFKNVQASMHRTSVHDLEAEDWAAALFETQSGVVGSMTATTAAFPGASESIHLYGTRGFANLEAGRLEITDGEQNTHTYGEEGLSGGGADPMAFTHSWHQTVIENFATCVRTGEQPLASGDSALLAHAVISAMEQASKTGQRTEVIMP